MKHANGVLVKLTIHSFTNERTDKEASQVTAQHFNASIKSGRYVRKRLPSEILKPIHKYQREARMLHYKMGAPWFDGGVRVLPAKLILPFSKQIKEIDANINNEVNNIVNMLPDLKQNFSKTQAGLFRLADFPTEDELRESFKLDVEFIPMPTSNDFRLDIISSKVKKEFDEKNAKRFKDQSKYMVEQIDDLLKRLEKNLSNDSPKIHKTVIDQVTWFFDNTDNMFLDENVAIKVKPVIQPIMDVVVSEYDPDATPKFNTLALDEARYVVPKVRKDLKGIISNGSS